MSCAELTVAEIKYLTCILRFLPEADRITYTARVTTLLSSPTAPSRLRRPFHLSLLCSRIRTPDAAPMCALHRRLNKCTIHSLFNQLAHEVGGNLDSLSLNHRLLSDQQRDQVERLRG